MCQWRGLNDIIRELRIQNVLPYHWHGYNKDIWMHWKLCNCNKTWAWKYERQITTISGPTEKFCISKRKTKLQLIFNMNFIFIISTHFQSVCWLIVTKVAHQIFMNISFHFSLILIIIFVFRSIFPYIKVIIIIELHLFERLNVECTQRQIGEITIWDIRRFYAHLKICFMFENCT